MGARSNITHRIVKTVAASPRWRRRVLRHLPPFIDTVRANYHDEWKLTDPIFASLRQQLNATSQWRFGPDYTYGSAKWVFDNLQRFVSIRGATYCDLGCGLHLPYGTSTILFLNDAAACVALDIQDTRDPARSAIALYDLLVDCLAFPERWSWNDCSSADIQRKVRLFDLTALREGDLEAGVANLPITHVVRDLKESPIANRTH